MATPLATVKERFGSKSDLVAAVEKFTKDDLWVSRLDGSEVRRLTAHPGPLVASDATVRPASLVARRVLHSVDGRRGPAQLLIEHGDLESMAVLLALLSRGVLRQRTLAGSFWDEDWSSVD